MDRFACMQGRAQPHVRKKHNSYTPDTNLEAKGAASDSQSGINGEEKTGDHISTRQQRNGARTLVFPTRACQRERCDQFPQD